MSSLTRWCAAALLAFLCLGPGHTPAALGAAETPDAGRTTWTLRPAGSGGADGRVSIRHELDPGSVVTDAVEVRNFGAYPATFRIYASDGVVGASGAFDVLPPGQEPADSGLWVSFGDVDGSDRVQSGPSGAIELQLEPESSAVVPFTITVPEDAVPGDHPAGVVAELVPEDDNSVQLTSRVGVRLHLRVAGEIEARVVAEDVHLSWASGWNPLSDGAVHVDYLLRNAGNLRAGTTAELRLAGPFGALPARAAVTRREILPGEGVRVETELPLWGLIWSTGQILVTPAPVGEDAPDVALSPARTDLGVWTLPWPQLGAVMVLAIGLVLWRRHRRRFERGVQERIDAAVAAATADGQARATAEEDATT